MNSPWMNLKWKLEGILWSNEKSLGLTLAILITPPDDMYVVFAGKRAAVAQLALREQNMALAHQEVL